MKRILLSLLFFVAVAASAQTTLRLGGSGGTGGAVYVTTTGQDALTPIARTLHTKRLCLASNLSVTPICTQAQLNALPNCGAGQCGTVYTLDGAGALQYAKDKMVALYFDNLAQEISVENAKDIAALTLASGSVVMSNTECANAVGGTLGNGCTRFQLSCRAASGGTSSDCK